MKQVQVTVGFVIAAVDIFAKAGDKIIVYNGVAIGCETAQVVPIDPAVGEQVAEATRPKSKSTPASERSVAVQAIWEHLSEYGPKKTFEIYNDFGLVDESEKANAYKDLNAGVSLGKLKFTTFKSNASNIRGARLWEAVVDHE